jgi:hypothetical protein
MNTKVTIAIESKNDGYAYSFKPLGISGWEPTRTKLASIVERTLEFYLARTKREKVS